MNGNSSGRRMPIRRERAELSGDYQGWWFEYRANPPLGRWGESLKLITSFDSDDPKTGANAIFGMVSVLEVLLLSWNFVDEEGQDLPLDKSGLNQLPLDLVNLVFSLATTGMTSSPLAISSS